MLRFLLNNKLIEEDGLAADLTVLDYLRQHQQLTGTKEGCASGDCGACTVVVATVVDGCLRYESINSCIAFIGAMYGKQVITVEHLSQEGILHPVQQAMVDYHGSQCGFCTPGFVMSMYAMTKLERPGAGQPSKAKIEEHLGGNLCRCTGYRPIIDAAASVLHNTVSVADKFQDTERQVIEKLQAIPPAALRTNFHSPQSLHDLFALMERLPRAPLLAGGTDLALEVTQNLKQHAQIVCLKNIADLNYCRRTDDHWQVGAGYRLTDFLQTFGALNTDVKELLQRFGSTQVRNQGTVGGNIANASPIGDLPPLCIALGADLVLESKAGQRVIALEDFFINYKKTDLRGGEIVSELRIPNGTLDGESGSAYCKVYKVSKRTDDDISAVCAAFCFQVENDCIKNIKIAFGGMAAIPKRALNLESVLEGQQLSEKVLSQADKAIAIDYQPISDARASAEYRLKVSVRLLRRLAAEISSPAYNTRVHQYAG